MAANISNEATFWEWFKVRNNSSSFKLIHQWEGYSWSSLNGKGEWEESDMWFNTPYEALIDFFSNLICCEVVEY